MLEYTVDGTLYEVPENLESQFIEKYPNAVKVEAGQPGKITSQVPGALVEDVVAPDMDFNSEDTFLDSLQTEVPESFLSPPPTETEEPELSWSEIFKNAFTNIEPMLLSSFEAAKAGSLDYLKTVAGEDATDFLLEGNKGAVAYIDPVTNEKVLFKNNPDRWKELNQINIRKDQKIKAVYDETDEEVGQATRQEMVDMFNKAAGYESEIKYIGGVIEGFKEGSGKKVVGGALNAIGSLATTMVPAIATRGASLYPQIAGQMYYSYNKEKSATKYGDDPEAMTKLVNNNEVELGVPMALGGIAAILEGLGLKGITNKIIQQPLKGKGAVLKLWGMLGEGATEYAQSLVETYNNSLGSGKSNDEALVDVVDALSSEETWEAAIQGFIGAGIVGQGARQINKLDAKARKHTGNAVGNDLDLLGMLRQVGVNSSDEDVKKAVTQQEQELTSSIKEKVYEGNEVADNLTEDEARTLVTQDDALETFKKQLASLNEKAKQGLITREEQAIARDAYKKQYDEAKAAIDQVVSSAKEKISKKNIKTAEKNNQLIETIEDPNSTVTQIQRAKDALVENNMGIVKKLVRTKFDPNKDTDLTIEDFEGDLMLELTKLINTFDSSKGEFGAYVATNLPKRIPRIFEKRIEKTATGDFVAKEDVTQRRDLISNEESDDSLREEFKSETISSITSELNIPNELSEIVDQSVGSVFGTKLPSVTDKNFKKSLQLAFRDNLADPIKKNLLGKKPEDFRSFIIKNFDALYTNIPQEAFNKRLPGLSVAVTDETGKQVREKTAVGKGIFEKANITAEEFADYFLGENLTPQLRSNRKVKLAEIVAEELGKDAAARVILDEEVASRFKQVQELLGQDVPANFQARIARLINRIDQLIDAANKAGKDIMLSDAFGVVAIAKELFVGSLKIFKATLQATQSVAKALEAVKKYISENFYNKEQGSKAEEKIIAILQKSVKDPMSVSQADIDLLTAQLADLKNADIAQFASEQLIPVWLENKLQQATSEQEVLTIIKDFVRIFSKSIGTSFSDHKQANYKKLSTYDAMFNKILKPLLKKYHPEFAKNFESKQLGSAETGIYYNGYKLQRYNNTKSLIYESKLDQVESEALNARKDLTSTLNFFKENYPIEFFDAVVDLMLVDQRGLIRKSATPGVIVQDLKKSETILEHDPPAVTIVQKIKQWGRNEITDEDLNAALDKFKVNLVSKKVDDILREEGLAKTDIETGRLNNDKVAEQMKKEKYVPADKIIKEQKEKELNSLSQRVEEMIETKSKGAIKARSEMTRSEAKALENTRKKLFRGIISPGADDVHGLVQDLYRKSKAGELDQKWFKENFFDLFDDAYIAMNKNIVMKERVYDSIRKKHKQTFRSLKEKVMGPFNNDMILRVYMYVKSGATAEQLGLSEQQVSDMMQYVNDNQDLFDLAQDLSQLMTDDQFWILHDDLQNFTAGSLKDDVVEILNKKDRAKFFEKFNEASEAIFTPNVLNKIEALYGKEFRLALEDGLYRMRTGQNRSSGVDPQVGALWNWFRGSVGVTMFFHTRSAILQTISFTNYIDLENNNIIAAAKAFANQDQFWKDFMTIVKSEYLVQRRGGLSTDINTQDLADDLKNSGRTGTRTIIAKLLQAGFSFTQAGDSFAIAFGGATYYRNQINAYLKQGLNEAQAEERAFKDLVRKTEESQQSARPDRLSKQQVSMFGKLFLAFQNVTAQMTRIMTKETKDIIAGRGNKYKKMSRIAYFFTLQNVLFATLQNALFAFMFPEDEEEEKLLKTKTQRVINNSLDTILRGTGVYGAIISTLKNVAIEFIEQERRPTEGKGRADHMYTMIEIANISAPIGIKARKLGAMIDSYRYNKGVHERMGADLDNPALDIIANGVSVGANVPLDRILNKMRNIKAAKDEQTETLHKILLLLGWNTWDLGVSGQREKTAEVKKEIRAERSKAKKADELKGLSKEEKLSRGF